MAVKNMVPVDTPFHAAEWAWKISAMGAQLDAKTRAELQEEYPNEKKPAKDSTRR